MTKNPPRDSFIERHLEFSEFGGSRLQTRDQRIAELMNEKLCTKTRSIC